jgi:hypothetical protein
VLARFRDRGVKDWTVRHIAHTRLTGDELFLECPYCGSEIELPGVLRNVFGEQVQCPRCLKSSTLGGTPDELRLISIFDSHDRDD